VCTAADIQNRAVRRVYLGYTSETCALAQRMSQLQQGAQIVNGVVCCATNGCNRPNTTGSSPTPVVSKYLIQLVLSMALSRAQFPDMLRERFREQIAVTAGLAVAEAGRVALVFSDAPSRRLLAGMLINATVNMPNASSVAAAAARLTEAALNSNLMAAGLPSVRLRVSPVPPLCLFRLPSFLRAVSILSSSSLLDSRPSLRLFAAPLSPPSSLFLCALSWAH
jgi:hypothetical protein